MRRHPYPPALLLALLPLIAAAGCQAPPPPAAPPMTAGLSSSRDDKRLTQAKLFALVTGLADRYVARVSEATDRVTFGHPSAAARERAVRFKAAVAGAAYQLSSSPNAEVALLDTVVHVSLMRDVVRGELGRLTFAEDRATVAAAFDGAYEEAWAIARQALSEQQLKDLKLLIEGWQKANPGALYVFRVRFEDFADARFRTSLGADGRLSPLAGLSPLAPVDQATAEMRQVRDLMERVVYISQRMPLVVAWEGEGMSLSILSNPDVQRAIGTSEQIAKSTDVIAKQTIELPNALGAAGPPAAQALAEYNRAAEQTRMMLGDAQATSAAIERLGAQVEGSAKATQQAFDSMKFVFGTLSAPQTRPTVSEVDKYVAAFAGVSAASKDLSQTAKDVKGTLESPAVANTVKDAKQISLDVVDTASIRAIQVIAAGCLMVLLTWVVMRVLDKWVWKRKC